MTKTDLAFLSIGELARLFRSRKLSPVELTIEANTLGHSTQTPPEGVLNPRAVLKARAGDEITMQFIMTNVYPHGTAVNAGVHYYVVRERDLGQKAVPAVSEEAVIDGTFTFALKPQARIGARQRFVIGQPGNYLLRVESQRTQRDHEHFSAIDLQIQ